MKWSITNSCHFQTHGPGKAMATEVMVAFGPPTSVAILASGGPMWQWSMVRTNLPQGCSLGGTSNAIKSKGLLGRQIYTRTSWPSCLYSAVCYSLGNHLLTFLNCHWIDSEVGWFPNPCTCSSEQECRIPGLIHG